MVNEYRNIARMIDHAVLRPDATEMDIESGAATAVKYSVASLCIRPSDALQAASLLENSEVKLSTVIGFPHGGDTKAAKLEAVNQALLSGVEELDVVLNIGQLLSGNDSYVSEELKAITNIIHKAGQKVKIIFENCYLEEKSIITACKICNEIGVDWVKTSTGFGSGGALASDVSLMREHTDDNIGIKASGGIRTLDDLLLFRGLGCSRIGASATASILDDLESRIASGQL